MQQKIQFYFFAVLLLIILPLSTYSQEINEIKFEKIVLSNGLQVILHEDHSTPVVTVNVWYHVGSKNEKKGKTGFAHLFEHLMFEGSENVGEGLFDKWLEAAGGDNNGSTTHDRTNYYENIPNNALELALYLESDRMANLLAAIDQKNLDTQRGVVQNERRQGVDNQPYGRVDEIELEALYPSNHPYSWPVIGSIEDLSAASLEDVKDFFRKYYTPNNASLCIAGDFNPVEAKKLVEKYFGNIPPGPSIDRFSEWIPQLDGIKKIEMKDNVSLPRIYMSWNTPPIFKPGDAELDMLASILGDGKNSRLYKSLVYEKQIAQDVSVYQYPKEISGSFHIIATARPGISLERLQTEIDTELQKIFNQPPSQEEFKSAVNNWEADFMRRLQSVGGFGGKADLLNQYNTIVGRPDYLKEDMKRYLTITPISLQMTAKKYIDLNKRVIINVVPEVDLKADENVIVDRKIIPKNSSSPEIVLPTWEERTLSNGLKVLVAEQHELPLVQFNLLLNAGWKADPTGKPGVSSLTSDLLDEGTGNRNSLKISQDLKAIGSNLYTSSSFDGSRISLNTLKKHLAKSLEIYSDIITNPAFAQEELERKKKEYIAQILQENREPFTVCFKNFYRTLYGKNHPYGQPYTGTGTEESVNLIEKNDLLNYYKTNYIPNNATLVVVGDITANEIIPVLEKALINWKKSKITEVVLPQISNITGSKVYLIDKPGAAQSVIVAGHFGLERNSPDYFKVLVMNTILGGKFTSRLNMNLRENKGYTYGASSRFAYLQGMGPFYAYAQVHTKYTKESLMEFVKEFKGIAGEIQLSAEELDETKKYITLRYPQEFETIYQISNKLSEIVTYNLSKDFFNNFVKSVDKISGDEITVAGKKYINPDNMIYMIIGDVEKIKPGIEELKLGEINYLDLNGNPVQK